MKKKPELMPLTVNPLDYDLIILGTPVWAWTFSPPMATLLSTFDFSGKFVALYSCHGGQNAKTLVNMGAQLKGSHILDEIDFFEPRSKDTEAQLQRAKEWASGVVSKGLHHLNSEKMK